ncbi:hypothetical protein Cfor_08699, partial [Coptotermes formosanus]
QLRDESSSQPRVLSWPKPFQEGRHRVENEHHARRPVTSVNPDNVLRTGELIRVNLRITVLELSQEGVLHLVFPADQQTINARYYSTSLNEKVKPAIRS